MYIFIRTKRFTNLKRIALVELSHFLSRDVLKSHKILVYTCIAASRKIENINQDITDFYISVIPLTNFYVIQS